MQKVIWVIVNYFNENETLQFINEQFLKQQYSNVQLWVVDNGSLNPEILKTRCVNSDSINLLQPNENTGYLGALFLVLSNLMTTDQNFDFIILSNTDLVISDHSFLTRFVNEASLSEAVWFGPEIISAKTGKDQNPYLTGRITLSKLKRLQFIFSNYILYILYRTLSILKSKIASTNSESKIEYPYALHGSFFMMKEELTRFLLKYREKKPFLYEEELFIAEICCRYNLKAQHIRSVKLLHEEHAVTGSFKSPKHVRYLNESIKKIRTVFFSKIS